MANNKYRYYVVVDGKIVYDEFRNFEDAIPTFLHQFNYSKLSSYLAIIKAESKNDIEKVNIINDKNSNFYILAKFGSNNGSLDGPINDDDICNKVNKTLKTYGSNHCKFFGVVKTTKNESLKLFNKF